MLELLRFFGTTMREIGIHCNRYVKIRARPSDGRIDRTER